MLNTLINEMAFFLPLPHLFLAFISFSIIFFAEKIARTLKIIDYPDNIRKTHDRPTAQLGGIILFCYIIPAHFIEFFFFKNTYGLMYFSITLIIYLVFFLVGLRDDQKSMSPTTKIWILLTTLFITLPTFQTLIIDKIAFKNLSYVINLHGASIYFTIFAIFALYNALNFADGSNGIAGSLGIFWILFLIIKSNNFSNFYYQAILFSLLIFLYFNVKKKLFLGNSGSGLLSSIIALLLIKEYKSNNIFCDEIFLILFLPGIDMIRITFQRISEGLSPFSADKQHFHHYLEKKNFIKKEFVFLIYITLSILPILVYTYFSKNFYLVSVVSIITYFVIFFLLKKKSI